MPDWFASLEPQVQSGWIAGLSAVLSAALTALTTITTVIVTQKRAKENLERSLTAQQKQFEATREHEGQRQERELAERREDRLFQEKIGTISELISLFDRFYRLSLYNDFYDYDSKNPKITVEPPSESGYIPLQSKSLLLFPQEPNEKLVKVWDSSCSLWSSYRDFYIHHHVLDKASDHERVTKAVKEIEEEKSNYAQRFREYQEAYRAWLDSVKSDMNIK